MKTYKLLKELPLMPAGAVFEYKENGIKGFWYLKEGKLQDYEKGDQIYGDAYASTLDLALRLGGRLEEIKPKPLKAYNGMYIGDEGHIEHWYIDEDLDPLESEVYATKGFAFLKKEDAEKFSKKLKSLRLIRKRHAENDGDFVPEWGDKKQEKYYIIWRKSIGYVINVTGSYNSQPLLPYFSARAKVKQCIEEIGDALLPLFED